MSGDGLFLEQLLLKLASDDVIDREEAITDLSRIDSIEADAALMTALEDADKGICESAAEAILSKKSAHNPTFLCQFLSSKSIATRNLASELLMKMGSLSIPSLAEAAGSPDHDVRKFAIDIIGTIRDRAAASVVIQALEDTNLNVVCSAAETLGLLADPAAVEALGKAYERFPEARAAVLEALGKIGDPRAIPLLKRGLFEEDSLLVFTAVDAMGNMQSREVETSLRNLLKRDDSALQEAVVSSLIKVAHATDHSILDDLPIAQLRACLIKAIRTGDQQTKLFALDELKSEDAPASIEILLEALTDEDQEVANKAKQVLSMAATSATDRISAALHNASPAIAGDLLDMIASSGNSRFLPEVIRLAGHENEMVRERVAVTLGKTGDHVAIPVLMKLATDSNGHVRSAALKSMGWIGGRQCLPALFAGLDDEYPDVRQAALGALILNAGPEVIEHFKKDLHDTSSTRQMMAVQALGWIGEVEVVEPLISALNHPEWEVRKSAVESLGRVADRSVTESIRVMFSDEEPKVRKAAIDAMVSLLDKDCCLDIISLLNDDDIWVRFHALRALGQVGDSTVMEEIVPFLTDENDILRVAAAKALSQFSDKRVLPFLRNSARDHNPDVAGAVNEAIAKLEGIT